MVWARPASAIDGGAGIGGSPEGGELLDGGDLKDFA
jgi:hypothetical protein